MISNNKNIKAAASALFFVCLVLVVIADKSFSVAHSRSSQSSQAQITVVPSKKLAEINPDIYGLFASTCYHEFDGGLSQKIVITNNTEHKNGIGRSNLFFDGTKGRLVRVNLRQKQITSPVTAALKFRKNAL